MDKELELQRLGVRTREIIECYFANPTKTRDEIASMLGITGPRVSQVLHHPRVVRAFPILAQRRLGSLIPKALGAQEEIITQSVNLVAKDKASARILEQTGVFSATRIDVNHSVDTRTVAEMRDLIRKAKELPSITIDAEVIEE